MQDNFKENYYIFTALKQQSSWNRNLQIIQDKCLYFLNKEEKKTQT